MLWNKSCIRRLISIAIAAIFLFVSVAASTESVSAASKLKVSVSKKTIYVGQTVKFKSNKNVKWSVTNKKVAKLTKVKKKTVTLKGLKAGTVYVKAKAGKKVKKIKITVKARPKEKIELVTSKSYIGIAEYCTVTVITGKSSGPVNDAYFASSDKSVLIVNSSGLVQGISPGTATITATSKKDKSVKASVDITVVDTKAGTLTLNVDLSDETRYPAGEVARVWLPVPQTDQYQKITNVKFDAPGARDARLTKDSEGGSQLYIEWDENTQPADRKASMSYHIYRRAVVRNESIESMEKGSVDTAKFAEYLKETRWSGSLTSGIVKETADGIVADAKAKTVYQKAFAIYDWMCDNLVREDDKTVIFGDVVSMLEGKRNAGSCMDMNSIFVALCRAEGIPARNMFGLRFFNANGNPPGPNCRAEFYLPGYGWVPADPAMSIKWGRGLGAGPKHDNDPTWLGIKDQYWGNGEENWISVNTGRDIVLDPPQSIVTDEYKEVLNPVNEEGISTINLYMFPYGEFGDQYIPCQDLGNFKYTYTFEEEDPLDCGC